MVLIYKDNQIIITKKNKNAFKINIKNWDGKYKKFWVNFPFSLMKIIEKKGDQDKTKEYTIKAEKLEMLDDLIKKQKTLDYNDCLSLMYDIGNQIQSLEMFNMGIPFLKLSDILVVDNLHYFIINTDRILPVVNKKITITTPYKRTRFFSLELQQIHTIPSHIHWKSAYYSLASLVITCLTGKVLMQEKSSPEEILDKLYATKLYWTLMRCLEQDPKDIYYLII